MTIKRRLQLVSLIVAVLVLLTSIGHFTSARELRGIQERGARVREVARGVSDLYALAGEYMIHRDTRVADQWDKRIDSIQALLAQGGFTLPAEEQHATQALRTLQSLRGLLPRIVEQFEEGPVPGGEGSAALEEAERRLVGQVLTRAQTLIFEVRLLSEDIEEEGRMTLERINLLVAARVIILIILLAIVLVWYRFVGLKELEEIQRGITVIANGNLDYKIPVRKDDELGMLARAFNEMATRLKRSYQELKTRTRELADKVATIQRQNEALDATKRALVNVLEDLEISRATLEEEKARDEALLGGIGDAVIAVNKFGEVIYMNESVAAILGLEAKATLGRNAPKLLPFEREDGKSIKESEHPFLLAISTGKKVAIDEFRFAPLKGRKFPISVVTSPVIQKGEIVGAIGVFRDISREKEIDRAKTEFVSLASHQLRTPLSAMNWYNEMLMAGDLGKLTRKQKEYLAEIYRASKRMSELVDALLSVSRIELGTFALEAAETDVCDIGKDVLRDLEPEIRQKKLAVSCPDIETPLTFSIDPRLARIIFQNLLANAVKYTPHGGHISLTMKIGEEKLKIVVSDTGIGIPKEQQKRVFEKFFRADNVRARDTDGTGLGLYIVKSLLDKIGGTIAFASEEGKGSAFSIIVPWQPKNNAENRVATP